MQQFKIRCSAISSIMAYPEKDEVPKGAITYLHQWVKEQLYSRKKEFSSKYTEKGTECEKEAIDFAAEVYDWGMVEKNEQHFENEYMTGTPDLILSDLVPDIKNSWDCFTFPLFDTSLNTTYEWQMQGYMALTGKEHAAVIYCLMDAPESIVDAEARKLMYKAGMIELEADFYDQVKATMTYSNMPQNLRIKRYNITRDDKAIKQIERRVIRCREYIAELKTGPQAILAEYIPADKITLFKIA